MLLSDIAGNYRLEVSHEVEAVRKVSGFSFGKHQQEHHVQAFSYENHTFPEG